MDTKEIVARFEQKRQALAVMEHLIIATVLDAGVTQFVRPYFPMELVRGTKITQYCDEARLTTHGRLQLFISVCHAVQHRDIEKPMDAWQLPSPHGMPVCVSPVPLDVCGKTGQNWPFVRVSRGWQARALPLPMSQKPWRVGGE